MKSRKPLNVELLEEKVDETHEFSASEHEELVSLVGDLSRLVDGLSACISNPEMKHQLSKCLLTFVNKYAE